MPDAKIIYLLRNPVDRAWAQAGMFFGKHRQSGLSSVNDTAIREFLTKEAVLLNSNYTQVLAQWERVYQPSQLFVGFFDELVAQPERLLGRVLDFLEVGPAPTQLLSKAREKRNIGQYPEMPPNIADHLTRIFYDSIVDIHRRFDNIYTQQWLSSADRHMSQHRN